MFLLISVLPLFRKCCGVSVAHQRVQVRDQRLPAARGKQECLTLPGYPVSAVVCVRLYKRQELLNHSAKEVSVLTCFWIPNYPR